jgi:hypothetical protein
MKKFVYSPMQAALGAFFGGPLASVLYLRANFLALGKLDSARKTAIFGTISFLVFIVVCGFLPESFPKSPIPIGFAALTHMFVGQNQFTKNDILDSKVLDFHSGWRTFLIMFACALITLVIGFILFFILIRFGVKIA